MPLHLEVAPLAHSNAVVLTWPSIPSNIALEKTTNVTSGNWATVTNTPALVGNNFTITNMATAGSAFFRLHFH
jgi:hypothetical protein